MPIPLIIGVASAIGAYKGYQSQKDAGQMARYLENDVKTKKYNLHILMDDLLLIDAFSNSKNCNWNRSDFLETAMKSILFKYISRQPASLYLSSQADKSLFENQYNFDMPWNYLIIHEDITNIIQDKLAALHENAKAIYGNNEDALDQLIKGSWKHCEVIERKREVTQVGLRPKKSTFSLMDVITQYSGKSSTLTNLFLNHLSNEIYNLLKIHYNSQLYEEGITSFFELCQQKNNDFKPDETSAFGLMQADKIFLIKDKEIVFI